MFTLVLGGSASGKSEWAENYAVEQSENNEKLYIATMQPFGEDAMEKITRHQALRKTKGFTTLEKYTKIYEHEQKYHTILLECMSTLLSNEMWQEKTPKENILKSIDTLLQNSQNLVVISNNIFADAIEYPKETADYIKMLGELNLELTQKADKVFVVVASIPIQIK